MQREREQGGQQRKQPKGSTTIHLTTRGGRVRRMTDLMGPIRLVQIQACRIALRAQYGNRSSQMLPTRITTWLSSLLERKVQDIEMKIREGKLLSSERGRVRQELWGLENERWAIQMELYLAVTREHRRIRSRTSSMRLLR